MTTHAVAYHEMTRNLPRAHEWDMVAGFGLGLLQDKTYSSECLLEPIVAALEPFGLSRSLLAEISAAVMQAGESLRSCCQEGKLDCVNVRVNVSTQSINNAGKSQISQKPWAFFLMPQIASSEPDTIEDPRCFIDLNVYQVF